MHRSRTIQYHLLFVTMSKVRRNQITRMQILKQENRRYNLRIVCLTRSQRQKRKPEARSILIIVYEPPERPKNFYKKSFISDTFLLLNSPFFARFKDYLTCQFSICFFESISTNRQKVSKNLFNSLHFIVSCFDGSSYKCGSANKI